VIQTPLYLLLPALGIGVAELPEDWRATGSLIAVLILLAVFVYLYIAGFFYGCRLYLATAVGNVHVASVFRSWQARRFHERVSPRIMAAQQQLIQTENPV
jgi:protein-S-isoprenylcysteine O-methyltransferase Ste14